MKVGRQLNAESDRYFEKRSLKQGSVGWLLLVGLGVSYTISGDFSGWNYGIAQGGWFGLAVAWLLMGLMYTCTVFGLAELSSALPTAGGGYGFARCALGCTVGFVTGLALLLEYVCAPAAVAVFISNYIEALGVLSSAPTILVVVAVYAIFVGIHIIGVGEALKLMFAITAVAVAALLVFVFGSLPAFDASNLFNIPSNGSAGSSTLLPFGFTGLLASLPFGIWFFLGVEGVPLAAEEASHPKRDIPRALMLSISILACTGFAVLLLVAGVMGAQSAGSSDIPLVDALSFSGHTGLAYVLNWAGLAGLVASFFSILYAGSRQMFALSRAGYLPKFLAITSARKTPRGSTRGSVRCGYRAGAGAVQRSSHLGRCCFRSLRLLCAHEPFAHRFAIAGTPYAPCVPYSRWGGHYGTRVLAFLRGGCVYLFRRCCCGNGGSCCYRVGPCVLCGPFP